MWRWFRAPLCRQGTRMPLAYTHTHPAPMFQARCRETLFVTDWGVPLAVALLLLGLIYLFIYLPASASSAEDAVRNLTEKCGHSGVDLVKQNVEEICRFPNLPVRKPLTYQAKQLIAREIELEKMRRTEAALKARNSNQESALSQSAKEGDRKPGVESQVQNHEQRLDKIVKRATFEEKPETDFFGRVIVKKKASPSTAANPAPEKNTTEKRVGRAVGQSDVWFRFNEGVSNAVRRNIYIKDLL